MVGLESVGLESEGGDCFKIEVADDDLTSSSDLDVASGAGRFTGVESICIFAALSLVIPG